MLSIADGSVLPVLLIQDRLSIRRTLFNLYKTSQGDNNDTYFRAHQSIKTRSDKNVTYFLTCKIRCFIRKLLRFGNTITKKEESHVFLSRVVEEIACIAGATSATQNLFHDAAGFLFVQKTESVVISSRAIHQIKRKEVCFYQHIQMTYTTIATKSTVRNGSVTKNLKCFNFKGKFDSQKIKSQKDCEIQISFIVQSVFE